MNELISVIINVYNGEKYIKKCLDCVINQTYKNLEILIINDGSVDNTLKIIKKYKDKRIKVINQDNMGLALSRNVGIDNAKGEYLYFIDVDDLISRDTISYLYKLCKEYDALISTCKWMDIYDYGFDVKNKNKKEKINILSDYDMLKKIVLVTNRDVTIWNKLMKKELFNDLRFNDRIVNDADFTHKLILKTDKIVYSNLVKYYYYKHNDSTSNSRRNNVDANIDMYKAYIERYDYIKKIYPDMIECEVGLLQIISRFFLNNNEGVINKLKKSNLLKSYKKLFSFKIMKSDVNIREKIKLFLFRISPKLHNIIVNLYLKLRGKK